MSWQLQDARDNLSKLIGLARKKGPQTISLQGRPAVVVLSVEDYERLVGKRRSLTEHLLSGPVWDDDFAEEVNRRPKDPVRDIEI
ncbi:type II toxin-antitoxin system Phd/YefM family antitoxin [Mesorhizobium sp. B2-4-17]|uniref:type II toxin-antitoxin system Phd/YefM family antitoxin n=1 Tax=Mesorhizobium sp. B2-4-17 TaxID=2589932 RepID=UPI00112CF54D|nr:type II toxin-antitoxin system Phd/YefM family antitoxin [Mesorhizobium sp. B2-4-17]TPK78070.1 type II toxin-antitoxin system Phd/YefM family antitoxin [Mesorhizobium sp. B2-4-17]